ncbi:MAG: HNH endonuclease [Actinobacteria bacterium]|nr:HNH endonuclease [Actinomycetota bacterium]
MEYDGRLEALIAQSSRAALSKVRKGEERTCSVCGGLFYVKPSHGVKRKFCSIACKAKAQSDSPRERKRKRAARHVRGWSVKAKAEDCCRNCDSRDRLHLHHIIPRGRWKAGRADLRNGVALCEKCHMGWHRREIEIPASIFTAEEVAFVSSADIGQDVAYWIERNYPTVS